MEFWGVEVKSGQPLEVKLGEGKVLHLSQACLGEIKNNKTNDTVCLHINIDNKKLVLGTLNSERLPQQLFDLVFDKDFQLSHNWKNGSVYFFGYKADQPIDDLSDYEDDDTDEEEQAELPISNGKQEVKEEENQVVANKKDSKQKVKIVEPEKDKKADEDDSDEDEDDSMSEDSDSDEDNEDSSDSEEDSDEEEETPKKQQQSGKKRPNESAIKTPANEKKAKMSTPQKTDGKKAGGHVATPHPSKQGKTPANKPNQDKTPANKPNQESPASASAGAHSCKSCNRSFKSDMALQSHNQAKHK